MKNGFYLHVLTILILTLLTLSSSCIRKEGSVEVTVDTLETDFFDDLKSANALKTYKGVLPCMECEGIYTELTIHEDSLTYKLSEKHLSDSTRIDTLLSEGTFVRNTLNNGQARLQLNNASSSSTIYFEASGDTMLYDLQSDGESRKEGLQITLKRE